MTKLTLIVAAVCMSIGCLAQAEPVAKQDNTVFLTRDTIVKTNPKASTTVFYGKHTTVRVAPDSNVICTVAGNLHIINGHILISSIQKSKETPFFAVSGLGVAELISPTGTLDIVYTGPRHPDSQSTEYVTFKCIEGTISARSFDSSYGPSVVLQKGQSITYKRPVKDLLDDGEIDHTLILVSPNGEGN